MLVEGLFSLCRFILSQKAFVRQTFPIECRGDWMRRIESEFRRCLLCMQEHDVETVEVDEDETFKGEPVSVTATYEYCPATDEFLESEEMIRKNSRAMKDAYRQKMDC